MDESVEKKIIEESADFSIFSLFLQADIVVKVVILILLLSSIWSWTIIFSKYTNLKSILMETEDFEEKFYSSETLSKLSKRIGGQPTHPMEAVFFAAMVYFDRIKTGFSNKNFDFKKSFCENVKKEMEIVINKELTGLENGLNFLASVGSTAPFIGLFGTVWGIMNSFRGLAQTSQATLSVVAPGISEALIATALGLFAAIPALIAYNFFVKRINTILNRYESFIEEFQNLLAR